MKGNQMYFVALSIIGIMIGIALTYMGLKGNSLTPAFTMILGLFVTIKEILDIFH